MKICDEALGVHPAQSMPARSAAHAGTWLAQLERAWLDRWSGAGEGAPSAAHRPAADSDPRDASQRATAAASDTLGMQTAGSARCGVVSSGAVRHALEAAVGYTGVDRSLVGVPEQFRAGGPSASVPVRPCDRPALTRAAPLALVPSETTADVERPSARNAGQRPHDAMEPPPSRTLMQVSVAQSTAQVTLRDASLSQGDVSRTGLAIASELLGLGLGLHAVRVYVNGVESRYGLLAREAEPARQRVAAGADLHSFPHRLLERK